MDANQRLSEKMNALEMENRRLEAELKVVRDEGQHRQQKMMMLKGLMKQKIGEMYTADRKMKEKMDEVEGQLEEAETIVIQLREELKSVREENRRLTSRSILSGKESTPSQNQLNRVYTAGMGKQKSVVNTELSLSIQPAYDGSGKGKGKLGEQTGKTSSNGFDKLVSNIVVKEAVGLDGTVSCWYQLQQPRPLAPEPIKHRDNVRAVGTLKPAVAIAERPPRPPPVQDTTQRKRKSISGWGQTSSAGGKGTQEPAEKRINSESGYTK